MCFYYPSGFRVETGKEISDLGVGGGYFRRQSNQQGRPWELDETREMCAEENRSESCLEANKIDWEADGKFCLLVKGW